LKKKNINWHFSFIKLFFLQESERVLHTGNVSHPEAEARLATISAPPPFSAVRYF
jgi:hypothetical protein